MMKNSPRRPIAEWSQSLSLFYSRWWLMLFRDWNLYSFTETRAYCYEKVVMQMRQKPNAVEKLWKIYFKGTKSSTTPSISSYQALLPHNCISDLSKRWNFLFRMVLNLFYLFITKKRERKNHHFWNLLHSTEFACLLLQSTDLKIGHFLHPWT